ncbi:MAG: DUF2750 domain-containing protein [Acinetobacter sp.]
MIDPQQLEASKQLTSEQKYASFIEQVLENGEIWGLCGEGWASFLDDAQGIQAFPVWSDKSFAEFNAVGDWDGFKATPFTIQQLINELAPELSQANIQLSVFKFPQDSGHLIAAELVSNTLQNKLAS